MAWNLLAPVAAAWSYWQGQPLLATSMLASAHWPWLFATLYPNLSWWGPITTHIDDAEPISGRSRVWLTIDDGPDPEDTPQLLELLDKHQAKATFFLIGTKVDKWPRLASDILTRGHQIGNHTMRHRSGIFWAMPSSAQRKEIVACQNAIADACDGYRPKWFRAPAGLRNHLLHPVLDELGLHLAGWNARGYDGINADPQQVLRRLNPKIQPNAILLMHEGRQTKEGARLAPIILSSILSTLQTKGLTTAPQFDPSVTLPD